MKVKENIITALLSSVFTAILIVVVYRCSQFRLDFKEQTGIFLWTSERIAWYLSNPAFLTSIAGDWLTQFFTGGISAMIIIVAVLALLCCGVRKLGKRLQLEGSMSLVLFVAFLELTFLKFPNYPLAQTLGLVLVTWAAYGLTFVGNDRIRSVAFAVSIPVMYVLAGSYTTFLALVLCLIDRRKPVRGISLALAGLLAMVILGRLYNLTFSQTMLYPVLQNYIVPDCRIILLQPVFIIISLVLKERIWYALSYGIISVFICKADDRSLEHAVKTGTYAYQGQWDKIRSMKDKEITGNPYWLYYRNLSYAIEGRLPDKLLSVEQNKISEGLFLNTAKNSSYLASMYNVDALIEAGDLSQATDCALLAQTVLPGHYSSRMLRKLAEISVIAGDYAVAGKYLDILAQTWGHHAWAENMRNCIGRDSIPLEYLILRDRASDSDRMFSQYDMNGSLNSIVKDNPLNKVAVDYLLCMCLLEKRMNSFIAGYDRYYLNGLDQLVEVPALYQEALMAPVNSDESFRETVEKYHLSQAVVEKYFDFQKARERENIPQEYMNTYWFYLMSTDFSRFRK